MADRLSHFAVHRTETGEESICAFERFVDKLVNNNQIAGRDLGPQGADSAAGDDGVNAELFKGEYIGGKRHLAWWQFMTRAVSVKKRDLSIAERTDHNAVAGLTEGRVNSVRFDIRQLLGQRITQTSPADYTYEFFYHGRINFRSIC
jgi:hypothetical protein